MADFTAAASTDEESMDGAPAEDSATEEAEWASVAAAWPEEAA
jgi:hypothetical protein